MSLAGSGKQDFQWNALRLKDLVRFVRHSPRLSSTSSACSELSVGQNQQQLVLRLFEPLAEGVRHLLLGLLHCLALRILTRDVL